MLVDYSMRSFRKKVYWWIFRRLIKIMEHFIEGHYCDAENIADNLRKFGTRGEIKIVEDELKHSEKYPKEKHQKFNVLYYFPSDAKDKTFARWLYGWDIFLWVRGYFIENHDISFFIVDGRADMKNVYPIVDFYLRPNRHDGASRLRRECDIQGIPYYWSKKDPSKKGAIRAINAAYNEKADNKV